MNPQMIALVMQKNASDIKVIINTIGIDNLLALMPHFLAIVQTIQLGK